MAEHYDLVIIGAGPGGYTAAEAAVQLGIRTAIIEKDKIGGAFINTGCVPAKALLQAVSVYSDVKRSEMFGVTKEGVGFDLRMMMDYKDRKVQEVRQLEQKRLIGSGVTYIHGTAKLHRNNQVEIDTAEGVKYVIGDNVIIASGAMPRVLRVPGIYLPQAMNSRAILNATEWHYDRLVVVGGGVIGVECATIFRTLGSEVTLLERSSRLLDTLDEAVSDKMKENLEEKGVRVLCGVSVKGFVEVDPSVNNGPVEVHYMDGGEEKSVECDRVLVSCGRESRVKTVLGDDCTVKFDQDGHPIIDRSFQTTQKGVYLIGDCISRQRLAHVATSQAVYVVEHIAKKGHRMQMTVVPNGMYVVLPIVPVCIFTDPEVATVGFTEAEAATYNMKVIVGRRELKENRKAILADSSNGFVKLIFEAYTHTLVGAQIICPRAADMIGELATAIANGLTEHQLHTAMRAQPTYSEAINAAIDDVYRQSEELKEEKNSYEYIGFGADPLASGDDEGAEY
ncbi:MAG: NAD(P)/FAD-dependent oxidoreductase [[Clostridium] aminophilum]|uniref:dihydrolipoyl dehydrogenase family protein n=1 Tax=[Clostridium] aminophilum TaxID=1526 RepID=UPI0026ED91CB|nr:NAD(P)/FAD-dependent oxidoreductase [[Clostridium] aminophilum]MDD6196796.1 NAD(P)/FAD-dependent oxidoreductase [[Clostridium] aminophilum]